MIMADDDRIHGPEMSPYSVKVRSYFRYTAVGCGAAFAP
jgi:hypothetical protein